VIQEGITFANREQRLQEEMESRGLTLVHPFDDWNVIHGQGTAALELLEDEPEIPGDRRAGWGWRDAVGDRDFGQEPQPGVALIVWNLRRRMTPTDLENRQDPVADRDAGDNGGRRPNPIDRTRPFEVMFGNRLVGRDRHGQRGGDRVRRPDRLVAPSSRARAKPVRCPRRLSHRKVAGRAYRVDPDRRQRQPRNGGYTAGSLMIPVKEVMNRNVITFREDTPIDEIASTLVSRRITARPSCPVSHVVGIVLRDGRVLEKAKWRGHHEPACDLGPEETGIDEAARTSHRRADTTRPCIRGGKMVGP